MNFINVKNLSFTYDKNIKLLNKINLKLSAGKFYLLTGPTGCGKSTLLKLIANLYPKFAGKILSGEVERNDTTSAMMFQNPSQQFTMATPRKEIMFALENLQKTPEEYNAQLNFATKFAQIDKLLDQKISTMSGGEQQRVALAVLIAMDVDCFILDEPFASCDPDTRQFLIKKLSQLTHQGKTVILTDHVFSDYENICDEVFKLENQTVHKLSSQDKVDFFKNTSVQTELHFPLPKQNKASVFNLTKTKIKQNRLLLAQDRLQILQGKITLITGPNGVGKSSFFKALTQMIPYSGSITYQDKEISKLSARKYLQHVAQIFQNATDQFLKVTVADEINLSKKFSQSSYFSDKKLKQTLKQLDLDTHLDQVVYSLSGGQQKKLQILLMLLSGHDVLLIDEPFSGLDHESAKIILKLIKETQQEMHQTILLISHQLQNLDNWCDYHLVFNQKKLTYVEN